MAGLLEALQNETPSAQEPPSPTSQGLAGYEPPSEAALLADGLIEPVRTPHPRKTTCLSAGCSLNHACWHTH